MNNRNLVIASLALGIVPGVQSFGLTKLGDNFELFVKATAALEYQDNIFLDSTNEVDDLVAVFSPGVELSLLGRGALSAKLSYQHHFREYDDNSGLDGNFADVQFDASYNAGKLFTNFKASYIEKYSNDADANNAGVLVERNETVFAVNSRYAISQLTTVGIGLESNDLEYENRVTYTGSESISVPLSIFYKVRPKLDLNAGIRYRNTDLKSSPYSYEDIYYFIGAQGEVFSPKWNADVSVGFQNRETDTGWLPNIIVGYPSKLDDESSVSYNGKLIYSPTAKASFYGALSRDYRSSALGGSSYALSSITLGGKYSITRMIGIEGSVQYGETEYQTAIRGTTIVKSGRQDDIFFGNLGVTYNPNENFTFRARYQYQDVDGNGLDGSSDYTNNKFIISASVRY